MRDSQHSQILPRSMSGSEKVAALLLAMGRPTATRLLKHFDPGELRQITRSAADLGSVTASTIEALIDDFGESFMAGSDLLGTAGEAQQLLAGVLPPDQIADIMSAHTPVRPAGSSAPRADRTDQDVGAAGLDRAGPVALEDVSQSTSLPLIETAPSSWGPPSASASASTSGDTAVGPVAPAPAPSAVPHATAVQALAFNLTQPDADPVRVRLRLSGETLRVDLQAQASAGARRLDGDDLRRSLEAVGYSVDRLTIRDVALPQPLDASGSPQGGAGASMGGSEARHDEASDGRFSSDGGGARPGSQHREAPREHAADANRRDLPRRSDFLV